MIDALILLRRFWYLVPMTVLGVLAAFWHVRADHALKARDVALEELRLAKVAAFDEQVRQRRIAAEVANDYRLKASLASARADDLANRLRQYLTRRPVPVPAAPGGIDGPAPESGRDEAFRAVADALGGVVRACSADSARLAGLQEYITKVTQP